MHVTDEEIIKFRNEMIEDASNFALKHQDEYDIKCWYWDRLRRLPKEYYNQLDNIIKDCYGTKSYAELSDKVLDLLNKAEVPVIYKDKESTVIEKIKEIIDYVLQNKSK